MGLLRRKGKSSPSDSDEQGYVLATTALLLIPLMIFAAFAVDVGGWYAEADAAQRAADAAALAGVVEMPDFPAATAEARRTALLNGYDHNDPDVSVNTFRRGSQGLRVEIETKGESYFGKVVIDDIDIERGATADYLLPVPLGNPGSSLGSGLDGSPIAGDPSERMLLALNAFCLGYNNGDPFGVRSLGTSCNANPNPRYPTVAAERGYDFILDFTGDVSTNTPVTGQWDLQIFEPGLCGQIAETGGAILHTTLWRGDDTLFSDDDNMVDANRVPNAVNNNAARYAWPATACGSTTSQWVTAYQIDADSTQGRWVLKTETLPDTTQNWLNSFGLRIVPRNGNAVCGSIAVSSACPRLYARSWLPIFIPTTITDVNGTAQPTFAGVQAAIFYLADVPTVHAGKTLEVKLFDPGEGMLNMQIIAPDGSRLPFQYQRLADDAVTIVPFTGNDVCPVVPAAADFLSPANVNQRCLDVTNDKFDGEEVTIRIPIPAGNAYSCPDTAGVENCWWRVRYESDPGSPRPLQDRTTWSIRVIGDPIRLTE